MIFLHADADILFDFEVEDISKKNGKYSITFNDKTITAYNIVISNGMRSQKNIFSKRSNFRKNNLW